MNPPVQTVAVIGGGVIGASVAYHLSGCGLDVTIIEKQAFGQGSSWGNCGIIVPSHVLPLNSLDNLRSGLRWMLKKDAPLHIPPRFDPDLLAWLLRFALRCNRKDIHRSAKGIASMLHDATAAYERIIGDERIQCHWRQQGALYLFRSVDAFRHYAATDASTRRYGHGCRPVERNELQEREPSVDSVVAGGWMDEDAAHLRPDFLMKEFYRVLLQRNVTILEHSPVSSFSRTGSRVAAALTPAGAVRADFFVLATGAWTGLLSPTLGVKVPIQPGKGYSVTFSGPSGTPSIPCFFEESRVVATPWPGGLRLGGTMEFAGFDDRLNRPRIQALFRAARRYLQMPDFGQLEEEWYGWRPMTFDGLPVIDFLPGTDNAIIAAGHNMLGITMAPATGRLVAEMITGAAPHVDPAPYRISRF